MIPSFGVTEIMVLTLYGLIVIAIIAGVRASLKRRRNDTTIATLVEENRRLREEIARISAETKMRHSEV